MSFETASNPLTDNAMELTPMQQTFALSFLSGFVPVSDNNKPHDLQEAISMAINLPSGSNWNVVWGPAIFADPLKPTAVANRLYVARNGTTNEYVVATS